MKLKEIKKENSNNKFENISYYHTELKERYLKYQEKNPSFNKEDIVTHVNIGLDQPYYTDTQDTPYLNTT
ncbi:MAG: hypothetical protein K2I72_00865 [Bacilli bacterium]|nr:hypothetical protein [Bacilli bacterium]